MKIYGETIHADRSGVTWIVDQYTPVDKRWKVEAENEETAIKAVESTGESTGYLYATIIER